MINNFVSMDYIMTFVGMVVIINLLTQFTKSLFDKIGQNSTKCVVYGYSFILCTIAAVWNGRFNTNREIVETCVIWLINSVIVWFSAMKAFETVTKKSQE